MEPKGSLLHSQEPTKCLYSELDQSSPCPPPNPISWRSILILSSHLCLGLPSALLPSGVCTKTLYAPLLFPICATCPNHLIHLDLTTKVTFGEEMRQLSSSLYSLLHSYYLISLGTKYSPQHPIHKHSRSTFLHQCKQPSFTPIQNKSQNYSPVYLNFFHIFG